MSKRNYRLMFRSPGCTAPLSRVRTLDEAKASAFEIMRGWIEFANKDADPEAFKRDVLTDFSVWAQSYRGGRDDGSWGDCWEPSPDEKRAIGWPVEEE